MTDATVVAEVWDVVAAFKAEITADTERRIRDFEKSVSLRFEEHDRKFASLESSVRDVRSIVHSMQADIHRNGDSLTVQGLTIERVARNTERVLDLLQPPRTNS